MKHVQLISGRLDFIHIVDKHKLNFFGNINKSDNKVVKQCFSIILKETPFSDVYVVIMILWSMMFFYLTKFMKNSVRYVISNCNC